jgi:hypothetical protein
MQQRAAFYGFAVTIFAALHRLLVFGIIYFVTYFHILCVYGHVLYNSDSIVTRQKAGRTGFTSRRGAMVGYFSLRQRVQTGSGTHPASYLMVSLGSFCGYELAGA